MRALVCLLTALFLLPAQAASVEVRGVRLWAGPDQTRVVFDLSGPLEHRLFTLAAPERVVIDLEGAAFGSVPVPAASGLVHGIRTGLRPGGGVRIVLDLTEPARPKSFLLPPNELYGHRLVVDLEPPAKVAATDSHTPPPASPVPTEAREIVIAVDAGHGGEDPGARGKYGTREKDVALAIARRLASRINAEPGMRAVLTRDGDYYVPLAGRVLRARKAGADMFLSIHADAFGDRRARGSSVYVLSRRGASSTAAKALADRENASDLVAGVPLEDKNDLVAYTLLDLMQDGTIGASLEAGSHVLRELGRVGTLHKESVQQAGFAVLKSLNVPSLLVETAFISNPEEERRLASAEYQERLASAMLNGIKSYFRHNPPPGTVLAAAAPRGAVRTHVISDGETLAAIARRYRVDLGELRRVNGLRGDFLRVGDVLKIPADDI
ncbi:MAG TPA: N-acetylmuramoyl-L-alanine amidase [Gammaproteobacteria bacterium]|nr:N-acetylmuramoyl-L-alanine amidase [Gammaproteobacteria bacterium]